MTCFLIRATNTEIISCTEKVNVNLSAAQSHNIKHSHTNVIYELVHKLGLLWWENGASLMRYKLISLPSHYEKSINLHLQKCIGKS